MSFDFHHHCIMSCDDGKIIIGEGNRWLEILGCGMVHPNVLKNATWKLVDDQPLQNTVSN